MTLCFWAAQTSVAALDLGAGISRSMIKTFLPPHTATTAIQRVYQSYVDDKLADWEWQTKLGRAEFELENDIYRAWRDSHDLRGNDNLVFLVSSLFLSVIWSDHLDYG
jgi:hypothetical protein